MIPVNEYLKTSYRPDCDYIDGEVHERNWGDLDHSRLQGLLYGYLLQREKLWRIQVVPEQRVQVRAARFRVPDICAYLGKLPDEQIFRQPPFLCIEILSPEDTVARTQQRIDDYLGFGVPFVWLINPSNRRAWVYTKDSVTEVKDGVLRTADPELAVPIAEVFDPE
jgi:Uma2 family endonuclease